MLGLSNTYSQNLQTYSNINVSHTSARRIGNKTPFSALANPKIRFIAKTTNNVVFQLTNSLNPTP